MEHDMNEKVIGEQPENKGKGFAFEVDAILRDFAYILAAVTIIFVFVVRLVGVQGSSMYPTLEHQDYMLLQSNFMSGDYEKGDIVVMTVPAFGQDPIVKRIIATEGQTVDIDFSAGVVSVDGVALTEYYINEPTFLDYSDGMTYPATVPEGCVFVMGDNRNHSTDSRYAPIGMVDTRRIMGKVLCIGFPGGGEPYEGFGTGKRDFSRIGGVK